MNQQQKNRRLIIIIFAMTIVPFMIAWLLKENPMYVTGRTNNGELILPPIVTTHEDYQGFDDFSDKNLNELKGHWLIVNVIPQDNCNAICQEALHKSKQLQLMLSKELTRARRIAIVLQPVGSELANTWWEDDTRLLKIKPSLNLIDKLHKIRHGDIPDGMIFFIDPLGNIMMQYEPGFDPYKAKNDLMHLLKISQIG
ncbi:MAG: hypothetical protein WC782_01660 [Methylococcaceae bacterium]|jgi:hypothetical protein